MASALQDGFGRRFSYIRVSVTDACNFRCTYCLPNGYRKKAGAEEPLTLSEIRNLTVAFAEMGAWKLRLTGGEPTLRTDILDIIKTVASVPGISKVALSTNGYRLKALAQDFRAAGLSALNVSVDTLNRAAFEKVTGRDHLPRILEGIEEALSAGFPWIKVNAVLMKDLNHDSQQEFFDWIRERPISVRFIELMPTAQNQALFKERHVRGETLRFRLLSLGWLPRPREQGDGPAEEFFHPDYQGRVGIIAPYSKDFCATCNRLRVTSTGGLRLCLFGESNSSLRHLLAEESQKEDLKKLILRLLVRKEVSHYLPEGRYGNNETFSAMGG